MNKTLEQLAGIIGCSSNLIREYLGRAEFAHITKVWNFPAKHWEFANITRKDIDRLSYLIYSRKKRKKQND